MLGMNITHKQTIRLGIARLARYGFAVVCVAIAVGLGLVFQMYTIIDPQRQLLSIAIVVATWYAGLGPSVLAVLLSTLCYVFFYPASLSPQPNFGRSPTPPRL
jgi:K+-sensing histidine kinase KdpD